MKRALVRAAALGALAVSLVAAHAADDPFADAFRRAEAAERSLGDLERAAQHLQPVRRRRAGNTGSGIGASGGSGPVSRWGVEVRSSVVMQTPVQSERSTAVWGGRLYGVETAPAPLP